MRACCTSLRIVQGCSVNIYSVSLYLKFAETILYQFPSSLCLLILSDHECRYVSRLFNAAALPNSRLYLTSALLLSDQTHLCSIPKFVDESYQYQKPEEPRCCNYPYNTRGIISLRIYSFDCDVPIRDVLIRDVLIRDVLISDVPNANAPLLLSRSQRSMLTSRVYWGRPPQKCRYT